MFNNAPGGYTCPICLGIQGTQSDQTLLSPSDIVYKDDLTTAFINSFFIKGNEGHVIVVPNQHFENLYDLPKEVGHRIFDVSKAMAILMKMAYSCDGITIRQNNELASGQHAFHYHMHVIPRYEGDSFITESEVKQSTSPEQRAEYANKMKSLVQQ